MSQLDASDRSERHGSSSWVSAELWDHHSIRMAFKSKSQLKYSPSHQDKNLRISHHETPVRQMTDINKSNKCYRCIFICLHCIRKKNNLSFFSERFPLFLNKIIIYSHVLN